NSGITISEEISRWLFIWGTLLGAVVALRERGHLGVDMVVARLPARGRRICLALSHVLMLFIVVLLLRGGLRQTSLNWAVQASTTGLSMAIVHLSAVVFSILAAAILLLDLYRIVSGRIADADLVMVQDSEESGALRQALDASASTDRNHS